MVSRPTPAKLAALHSLLQKDGLARFKNGSRVKLRKDGLDVRRVSGVEMRFSAGNLASAYAYALLPPRGCPAPSKPQPPCRDWGSCPF